jgi:hypothetical protein
LSPGSFRKELIPYDVVLVENPKERSIMANNKNPNQKRPGEKEPGKFHFNPGNQSGKTAELFKDESEREANKDRIQSRRDQPDQKR